MTQPNLFDRTHPTAQPLAEVFGFNARDLSKLAQATRQSKSCPFQGVKARQTDADLEQAIQDMTPEAAAAHVGQVWYRCNKASKDNPLGVCSVLHGSEAREPGNDHDAELRKKAHIICPKRFEEGGTVLERARIVENMPATVRAIKEVKLLEGGEDEEQDGRSAGNIDWVLTTPDAMQYWPLEYQAVYCSGNVRRPFASYMMDPQRFNQGNAVTTEVGWDGRQVPHPDYLSSGRKRLMPQMAWKGSIINQYARPLFIVVQDTFLESMRLPAGTLVNEREALPEPTRLQPVIWLICSLRRDQDPESRYRLTVSRVLWSDYNATIRAMITARVGREDGLRQRIRSKL